MIVQVSAVLNRTVVDVSTTCAVVIFRVKESCITKVDGIKLWLLSFWVAMLLVIGRLSIEPWCYWLSEDSKCHCCVSIRFLSQFNSRLLLVKLQVAHIGSLPLLVLLESAGSISRLHGVDNCWLRFIGILSKLVKWVLVIVVSEVYRIRI